MILASSSAGHLIGTVIGWIIGILIIVIYILIKLGERIQLKEGAKKIVCPHCNHVGCVTARATKQKRGISGGKATGAILTGGASLFVTGLSRKQNMTELRCSNCRMKWLV